MFHINMIHLNQHSKKASNIYILSFYRKSLVQKPGSGMSEGPYNFDWN